MSAESFQLKIITPAGVALEEDVATVTVPSANGEIGILPDHAEYTALLGVGVLTYKAVQKADLSRLVVTGGFCQFNNNVLTVLADSVDLATTGAEQNSAAAVRAKSLGKTAAEEREEFQKIVDTEDTQTDRWRHAKEQLSRLEAIQSILH
jgi:F-type H+-transporting ATPase subunit epsilon